MIFVVKNNTFLFSLFVFCNIVGVFVVLQHQFYNVLVVLFIIKDGSLKSLQFLDLGTVLS